MSVPSLRPPVVDGGLSPHPTSCENVVCQNGHCVLLNKGPICECNLGYTGDSCHETINEALSVPLTLGVLVVIVGFIVLFFVVAFFRQKQKAKKSRIIKEALNIK